MTQPSSRAVFPDRRRGPLTTELKGHRARLFRVLFLALAVMLGSTSVLHAATATWNANPETDIAGYILSYGTSPGVHPTSVNVGNVLTWQSATLTPGQTYYFVVQAYNTSRRQFPANLTAKMFGFKEYPFFQAPPDAKQAPKVNFSKPS